jgi:hypothetical protein
MPIDLLGDFASDQAQLMQINHTKLKLQEIRIVVATQALHHQYHRRTRPPRALVRYPALQILQTLQIRSQIHQMDTTRARSRALNQKILALKVHNQARALKLVIVHVLVNEQGVLTLDLTSKLSENLN